MRAVLLAVTGGLLTWATASEPAHADFLGLEVEVVNDLVDTPACLRTYRLSLRFSDPADQVIAAGSGYDFPFFSLTLDGSRFGLINDEESPFAGTKQEDFATAPIGAAWDSYVTIGADGFFANDTDYSPGFAGADGTNRVITGTSLSETSGGWFDRDPSTPVDGGTVLIMQITVDPQDCLFAFLEGAVFWQAGGVGPLLESYMGTVFFCGSCAGDVDGNFIVEHHDLLLVLAGWGPCPDDCCPSDIDRSGVTDLQDLLTVLDRWGTSCLP